MCFSIKIIAIAVNSREQTKGKNSFSFLLGVVALMDGSREMDSDRKKNEVRIDF